MPREEHAPESVYKFDVLTGQLLVGQVAVDAHLEMGGHPQDLEDLTTLLTSEAVSPDTYPMNPDIDTWEKDEYRANGKWLISILPEPTDRSKHLNRDIINRAGWLGISPNARRHYRRFGSLSEYYNDIGVVDTHKIGLFDDWTRQDYVDFIQDVARQAKRKPTEQILWDRKHKGHEGPSAEKIRDVFGSMGTLLELAGYPDIRAWTEADYVDWGVKFMFANEGQLPTSRTIQQLSKRKRGPSSRVVMNKFQRMTAYQELVQQAYDAECERRQIDRDETLHIIKLELDDGVLPRRIAETADDDDELIASRAKYRVLSNLIPSVATSEAVEISSMSTKNFTRRILAMNSALKAADIEEEAEVLQVFDTIWPMDDYKKQLKIRSEWPKAP